METLAGPGRFKMLDPRTPHSGPGDLPTFATDVEGATLVATLEVRSAPLEFGHCSVDLRTSRLRSRARESVPDVSRGPGERPSVSLSDAPGLRVLRHDAELGVEQDRDPPGPPGDRLPDGKSQSWQRNVESEKESAAVFVTPPSRTGETKATTNADSLD